MPDFQKAKSDKPQIEDKILELVSNEQKQDALDFIGHIRAYKMTLAWASINAWKYNYKGKRVGYIRINNGNWMPQVFTQYDTYLNELVLGESEEIKAFVDTQVGGNVPCGGCMPGADRRTVTKELRNICACTTITMENPDENLCKFAKKLITLRRDAISNGRVPKCDYVKPADRT